VEELLEQGFNANLRDSDNYTPLHMAALSNKTTDVMIAQLLLNFEADIDSATSDQTTALQLAARKGNFELVSMLMQNGADVRHCNAKKQTTLHFAAIGGGVACIKLLLRHRLNVNAKDVLGRTPLHEVSTREAKTSVLALLIHHGAQVDSKDKRRETPLHLAAFFGKSSKMGALLNFGASLTAVGHRGNVIHLLAKGFGKPQDIVHLVLSGAPVDDQDSSKQTALHCAIRRNRPDLVRQLLHCGASTKLWDYEGRTPLETACKYRRTKCVAEFAQGSSLKRAFLMGWVHTVSHVYA